MRRKEPIFIGIGAILVINIMLSLVGAVVEFEEYGNISIESSVLNALTIQNKTSIRVIVSVNESINENRDDIKAQIVLGLTLSEFKLIRNLNDTNWFSGELTKEGLEKLRTINKITRIYESRGGGLAEENITEKIQPENASSKIEPTKEKNESLNEKVEPEVYTNLKNFEWVRVIVDIDSKDLIDNLTLAMPEAEFKFIRKMMFRNAFVAEITSEGLEILISNPYINKISWDRVAYTLDGKTKNESSNETKIETKEVEYLKNNWQIIIPAFIILAIIFYLIFRKKK